eukprot:8134927-Pyramimonas_sp.AAC.2
MRALLSVSVQGLNLVAWMIRGSHYARNISTPELKYLLLNSDSSRVVFLLLFSKSALYASGLFPRRSRKGGDGTALRCGGLLGAAAAPQRTQESMDARLATEEQGRVAAIYRGSL